MTTILVRKPYHGQHHVFYDGGESFRGERVHLDHSQTNHNSFCLSLTSLGRTSEGERHQTDIFVTLTAGELTILFACAGDLLGLPYTLPADTPRPVRRPTNERRYAT